MPAPAMPAPAMPVVESIHRSTSPMVRKVAGIVDGRVLGRAPVHARSIVFAHGSLASGRMWEGYARAFEDRCFVRTPDLVGYGSNPEWPADLPFRLMDEVSDFALHIDGVFEPFDIVAHSYGAAVALRFACEFPERVRSLTLIEPTVFPVLDDPRHGAATESDQIRVVAARVRDCVQRGDRDAAMRGFVDYWNGQGAWQALAPDLRRRCAAQGATVARNFEAAFGDDGICDDLRYLDVPTLLISGGRSTAAARATTRIAASLIRCAKIAEIASAGHMAPVTHADAVLRLVLAWLDDGAAAHRLAV